MKTSRNWASDQNDSFKSKRSVLVKSEQICKVSQTVQLLIKIKFSTNFAETIFPYHLNLILDVSRLPIADFKYFSQALQKLYKTQHV